MNNNDITILHDELLKLDKRQLKLFYSVLVHYWVKNESSTQAPSKTAPIGINS